MASSIEQSPFFQQKRAKGDIVVTGNSNVTLYTTGAWLIQADPPKFDLESYIGNYAGLFSPGRVTR